MSADLRTAAQKAEEVLKDNYIDTPPIDVWGLAESYGLSIMERDFGDKFADISGFINPEKYLIVISRSDSKARQAFTIAHELGHWIMHKPKLKEEPNKYAVLYRIPLGVANKDPIEAQANCFAANLLVPKNMFDLHASEDDKNLADLFNVSLELIRFRRKNIECGGV